MVSTPTSLPGFWLSLAAIAAYAVPALGIRHLTPPSARLALRCAWVLHGLALAFHLLSSPPHFGFGPALSITAWLVLTVYAVEQQMFPQMRVRWTLAALGAVAVVVALIFPGQPLHAMASAWLPLHLALGIACYGLFAAAVVHAALMSQAEQRMRAGAESDSGMPLLLLERLTFRFVTAGFILLTATLMAGWLFGDQLYGRTWRWNHKEVFSLLSWIVFAVLLIGRSRFGWRSHYAVRMIYAGALLLLLAYVGSRFVMEVVLQKLS